MLGLVADPVIQAIEKAEFDDVLRMASEAFASSSMLSALSPWSMLEPILDEGLTQPWGQCRCCSFYIPAEFRIISDILDLKNSYYCGVRIKLAYLGGMIICVCFQANQ